MVMPEGSMSYSQSYSLNNTQNCKLARKTVVTSAFTAWDAWWCLLLKAIGVLTVVLISSGNKRCEPVHSVCRFQHLGISILRSRHYLVFMHVHNECNDWVKIPISQCTHVKLGYLTLDSQKGLHLQELGLLPNFIIEHIVRARMRHNSSAQRPGSLYCILVHGLLSSSLPCIIVFD